MEPITRKEMYLAAAAGQDVALPEPITREEKFLYKIAMRGGTGVSSWNDLTDKPFDDDRTEILPKTQMVYIEESELFATEFTQTFVEGNTYIVNWNGTEYTCVAFAVDIDGDGVNEPAVVGNPVAIGGESSDVPFTLLTEEGMLAAMALDGSTEVTLSIILEKITKIPEKYLDEDWPKQTLAKELALLDDHETRIKTAERYIYNTVSITFGGSAGEFVVGGGWFSGSMDGSARIHSDTTIHIMVYDSNNHIIVRSHCKVNITNEKYSIYFVAPFSETQAYSVVVLFNEENFGDPRCKVDVIAL